MNYSTWTTKVKKIRQSNEILAKYKLSPFKLADFSTKQKMICLFYYNVTHFTESPALSPLSASLGQGTCEPTSAEGRSRDSALLFFANFSRFFTDFNIYAFFSWFYPGFPGFSLFIPGFFLVFLQYSLFIPCFPVPDFFPVFSLHGKNREQTGKNREYEKKMHHWLSLS